MPRKDPNAKRLADNAYVRTQGRIGRDITAGYPEPGDSARRAACERDFRRFCEVYFPNAFDLAWSDNHLKVIARMEAVVLGSGLYALAMPRGNGKTVLATRAALWALLYGHRRFVSLVGATEKKAKDLLKKHINAELSFNELLAADFRQVCYPIRRLENNGRLAIGQLFDGAETRIDWSSDRLTFPIMPDWACDGENVSGSTVTVAGLTGSIRGQSTTLANGTILRPELVILDDPQTRASAMSAQQNDTRSAIVKGDVLGMAGPDRKISAIMPCTVIRSGDMADQLLDRSKNPEWSGLKTRMVDAFPKNVGLWDEYWAIRSEDLAVDLGIGRANQFFRDHRPEMDEGAEVTWPARFDPSTEDSAIQAAMNLRFRDERAFFAEYQNEPLPEEDTRGDELTADEIVTKFNRLPRRVVPLGCTRVTAMIDVQASLLYYAVAAWEDNFTGAIIDYGAFPDQKRAYFTARDAKNTFSQLYKAMGAEGRIYAGLEAATEMLLGREWPREDAAAMRIERLLIDSGKWTDLVLKFCRQSKWAGIVTPSKGMGLNSTSKPFLEYEKRPGDKTGHHWRIPGTQGRGPTRVVLMDVNYWKSFLHSRLAVATGDRGSLTLFGDKPEAHRMLADHLTAETCHPQTDEKSGRRTDVWKERPGHPDNHLLDTAVGCAVAASMQGAVLAEARTAAPQKRRLTMAEMQAQAAAGAAKPGGRRRMTMAEMKAAGGR